MSLLYQYRTYGKKLTGYGAVERLVRAHFIEVDTGEEPAPLRFGELHCLLSLLGPTEKIFLQAFVPEAKAGFISSRAPCRHDLEQKHGGLAIVKTGVVPTTLTNNLNCECRRQASARRRHPLSKTVMVSNEVRVDCRRPRHCRISAKTQHKRPQDATTIPAARADGIGAGDEIDLERRRVSGGPTFRLQHSDATALGYFLRILSGRFYFKIIPLSSKGAAGNNGIRPSDRYFLTCRRR